MTTLGDNPPRGPARFYKAATIEPKDGAHHIMLDGRQAKTRRGKPLAAMTRPLADAIAAEWNGQGDNLDFSSMPMTRLQMTLADLGADDSEAWRAALLSYLASDLVCYRAHEPSALVERQSAHWDPLADWFASFAGRRLKVGAGVSFIAQPSATIAAARERVDAMAPGAVLAAKSAADIAGSAVIGLALAQKAFEPDALFAAARVDERFQAERWGVDAEAAQREKGLYKDFLDIAHFVSLA